MVEYRFGKNTMYYLDFEKPIEELEQRIQELRRLSNGTDLNLDAEIRKLEKKAGSLLESTFGKLSRWQKTQIARHPDRPYTLDYIEMIAEDFVELHGDRRFGDDPAIVGGLASVGGESVVIIGHQKGRGVKARIQRNFGQPHPEGYRKALRLIKLAEKFGRPVLTLIDTPGAYPGIGAEERGQAEAIALNLMEMARTRVPMIATVIGEGGSGGALGIGVADRLFMLEHSVYSVISPEGCAAILWKKGGTDLTAEDFTKAADALRLTAQDLLEFGVIDEIIPEPTGGAHRDPQETARKVAEKIGETLADLKTRDREELVSERYDKLQKIGRFREEEVAAPAGAQELEEG